MKHTRNNSVRQAGFSLVELLLYMGLISILLVILMSVFLSALDVQQSSQATSSVEQEGRYLLTRLAYDMHRASSVTTPDSMGSSSPTLTIVIGGVSYAYTLSNNQLLLALDGSSESLSSVDSHISDLSFTKVGSPSGKATLHMTFTVQGVGTSSQPSEIRQYSSSVGLR